MSHFTRALAIGCLSLLPATTLAQSVQTNPAIAERPREPLLEQAIRLSTRAAADPRGRLRTGSAPLLAVPGVEQRLGNAQPQSRQGRRSPARRILGAIVGGTGGFFAGGYTGAWIEGDRCECDDPGLKGAVIGAPIGAAVGGVLGGLFLF